MRNPTSHEQLKRAVLLQRLQQRHRDRSPNSAVSAIAPVNRNQPLVLSWAQQRLWFLDQLDPAARVAYHMPAALRLRGSLDRAALRATLDRIVARHEMLRTRFVSVDGAPVQLIAPADIGFHLSESDLSERYRTVAEREAAALSKIESDAQAPFDLAAGPLIRGHLLRLADDEHILLVTQHHISSDGWSIGVLVREISSLYSAYSRGEPDPLPPLAIQYADYAAWQRQHLQGETLQRQVDFWTQHLAGAPALLELPTDHPRPALQSHAGGFVPLVLPAELSARLRALSHRHGVTLFMTLLAGWSVLLSRLSGQRDLTIGTPFANRTCSETERLLGFFVNTLALRIRLDDDPSVTQLLAQIKRTTLEAYAHQDLPFEHVFEVLQPARSLSHSPIFQVMLALDNTPDRPLSLPGLTLEPVRLPRSSVYFDLSLFLSDSGGVIAGNLEYASALFDHETVERFAGHFVSLLQAIAENEQQHISRLPLLSAGERHQLLVKFNDSAASWDHRQLIHRLFEARVAEQPDAIAVLAEEGELSYRELNRRANRLAHRLLRVGIRPDDRVAIGVERGLPMIVGLLAILKAGGAYVPLDPAYPTQRLVYMLADSRPMVLLTLSAAQGRLPTDHGVPVVLLDDPALEEQPDHDLDPKALGLAANHLAYVIYTSGSTGEPKGVMLEHANVVNLIHAQIELCALTAADRVLQFASFSFDNSVAEIFPALSAGATVVLRPHNLMTPDATFVEFLQSRRVTVADLPTSFWHQWAQQLQSGRSRPAAGLRVVLAGGEKAELRHLAAWFSAIGLPGCRWINTYGPTETTVNAAVLCIDDESALPRHEIPIGRPVANSRIYILDPHREPVPIGVAGEIYIGGACVARGYLNRPELSAERFITDPFATSAGARLYKTGDLGRFLADGTVEYLGRNDFQVKIRGFRIELGEIEARLASCSGVREAVVISREDSPGDKRLVAYLLAMSGSELSVAELRAQLAAMLPEHMLPAAFVQLDTFPLTPNGKLDRNALPAPDRSAVVLREYEQPQGPVELAIAAVWQDLLHIERVGRHDHFFELGGHSLLVVSLIERLRERGIHASVRSLFSAPVLSEWAAKLIDGEGREAGFVVPPNPITAECSTITPAHLPLVDLSQDEIDGIVASVPGGAANVADIYPLAPMQEGILFHHLFDTEGDTYLLRSITAFDSRERLDGCLAALQKVIDRHDILRSSIRWSGLALPVQVVHRHARLPVEELAHTGTGSALQHLLDHTDPRRTRIDLTRAPLMAATVVSDPQSGEWLMALLQHHIVTDHVTLELCLLEVRKLIEGHNDSLAPPVPYRHFVAQARSVPASVHEAYFRRQLGDIDQTSAPFGVVNVQEDGSRVTEIKRELGAELTRRIRTAAGRSRVSPAILFHVAWAQVVAHCSGSDDVVFGTTLSGRLQGSEGAGSVLGMFINTLPLRVTLAGRSAAQAVAETYRRLGELVAHEQAPLALAQRCSGVGAAIPLFTTLLNYHRSFLETSGDGASDSAAAWQGMRVLRVEERTNYPITVSIDDLAEGYTLIVQCIAGIDAQRVSGYLATAVAGLVDALEQQPDVAVCTLPIVPPEERVLLLGGFAQPDVCAPAEAPALIHALFERQAAAHPDSPAVVFEGSTLSYAELNRRANQLAHRLLALGVLPDERVALCLERSCELIVAVLAVLKAGAAYVPLDPAYPPERLAYMLTDSAPVALITQTSLRAICPASADLPLLLLDDAETFRALCSGPEHDPQVAVTPQHLAYVIYTSGSTGQPKGVMVEHAHVTRLFAATREQFNFDASDVWTLFHSFAFDFSVWEIWGALLHGARLVVVPALCARAPEQFHALLCRERVTVLNQTPSAFRALIDADARSSQAHALRCIVFGGEALELQMLAPWIARNDPQRTRLVNMYGITEITVHATYREISAADVAARLGSVIGRALPDLRLLILDRRMQPVPPGVAGEMYVGGAGVARGYLNRPALSAERFLADPFGAPGARLYKTGDLARWLADGTIEFLGRNDLQVKIRGFRIEPAEIEAALLSCHGVRDALVVAREDTPGDKRLVAYLVGAEEQELAVAALRAELALKLPAHMLPGAFVQLASLPLTPNGKLDRRSLPAPDQAAFGQRAYQAPQGPVESTLARLWQELLGLQQVGRDDHFFELGGHSLLVVSLIERLRQHGLRVDVRSIFAAPTLAALAARLESAGPTVSAVPPNLITPACREITPELLPLLSLTQSEIDSIVAGVPGGVANVQDIYPLAPLQEGILFHHLLQREGDAYLLRSVLQFDSRARLNSFVAALQHVIDRHDILRSAVHWQGLAQAVQVVQRQAPLPLVQLAPAEDALAQLLQHTDPRRVRLDLRRAPLLAASVIEGSDGAWLMALLSHHMVDDNYTLQLMLAEVRAVLDGRARSLAPALPYRNFIAQLRTLPQAEHEAYFRAQLGDVHEPTLPFGVLEVPPDAPIEEATLALDAPLAARIRSCARAHGVSAAVLFHAAWARVLAACSARDDVVFGTTVSGRLQGSAGADRVLGLFINTLPMRLVLAGCSVMQWLAQTQTRLAELLAHEQASLALAQRCSAVAAPLPLFTALLNYRHTQLLGAQHHEHWPGVQLLRSEERTNYALTMSVNDLGQGFELNAQCVPGIDAQRVVCYLATAIDALVHALANDPQQPAHTLAVLPEAERRQLLVQFNATAVPYPHDRLIHQLVEQQAAARPEASAVVFGEQTLSYRELNQRANRLAHRLLALGVKPDQRVAVCMQRSVQMVVALLGVLKAGAAYVPLDPQYPAERIAYMLQDCAPAALLTNAELNVRLPADVPVLTLDDPETQHALALLPSHNIDPRTIGLASNHLAYVLYTSGSTGVPKGVANQHDGVVNRLLWARDQYAVREHDRVLQKTPFSFDVSVWEFFLPLLAGATLVVAKPGGHQDPDYLARLIESAGITLMHFVPSMLHVFLDHVQIRRFPTLRRVLCSGEALPHALQQRFEQLLPNTELHNLYGPTEAAIDVTSWRCDSAQHAGKVPIGRPIANTRIHILDRDLQIVPLGVPGEIHIGGIGVARGYLNRAELTAERFIADPFSTQPGARLYKTGDLGRWLPDGAIEYLGRNDFQVKIRGFRVELGEIEARLNSCLGVREAVVVAREDSPGDQRLVAYLLTQPDHRPSDHALRAELAAALPEHMLPGSFVHLEAFPLTHSGKLDRRVLPCPARAAAPDAESLEPRSETEVALARLWCDVLHLDSVGLRDNFFDLGGHSLQAATLTFKINSSLTGNPISLVDFYDHPTIEGVSALLGTGSQREHRLLQRLLTGTRRLLSR